jgi:hypothetical protein
MELFTKSVASRSHATTATEFPRSGVSRRSAAFALILAVSCVCLVAGSSVRLRRQERLGHSRIPRTVLRTILSDDLFSTLGRSPHIAPAWTYERLAFEIRQSGISIGQNFRLGIPEVEILSQRDRSPPQV